MRISFRAEVVAPADEVADGLKHSFDFWVKPEEMSPESHFTWDEPKRHAEFLWLHEKGHTHSGAVDLSESEGRTTVQFRSTVKFKGFLRVLGPVFALYGPHAFSKLLREVEQKTAAGKGGSDRHL